MSRFTNTLWPLVLVQLMLCVGIILSLLQGAFMVASITCVALLVVIAISLREWRHRHKT